MHAVNTWDSTEPPKAVKGWVGGWHTSCISFVVAPVSAGSANSHHGCFSLVQNANGMAVMKHAKFNFGFQMILT